MKLKADQAKARKSSLAHLNASIISLSDSLYQLAHLPGYSETVASAINTGYTISSNAKEVKDFLTQHPQSVDADSLTQYEATLKRSQERLRLASLTLFFLRSSKSEETSLDGEAILLVKALEEDALVLKQISWLMTSPDQSHVLALTGAAMPPAALKETAESLTTLRRAYIELEDRENV